MHEHLFHLLLASLPFFGVGLILVWNNRSASWLKSLLTLTLFLVITIQAIPIHYLHAAHSQNLQSYECCIPTPVTPVALFQIETPPVYLAITYFFSAVNADYLPNLTLNSRSPPV